MSQESRRKEILEIIQQNPGATGATISMELAGRSKVGQWLGRDSLLAMFFTLSLGSIYVHLLALENQRLIYGLWEREDYPRRRRYFAVSDGEVMP